jgi:tRNA dimethylallyltransferase
VTSNLLVLAGPTAVGKSELALRLAESVGGQILSVDSRQVVRGMDIGTAKPSAAERARVPHHLLDLIEPHETYSAGRFVDDSRAVLKALSPAGCPVLLVGGSGLYLQALLDGLFEESTEERSQRRSHWQERLAREGRGALWTELGRLDPAARARLQPADEVRLLRALELAEDGGRAVRWRRERLPGLGAQRVPMVCLTRHRDSLTARIGARVDAMLRNGWRQEVAALLDGGVAASAPGLMTMGYQELVQELQGRPPDDVRQVIQRRTRQYAKRQMTWFRRDRRFRWLDLDRLSTADAADRLRRHAERVWGVGSHVDSAS